jgi:hypothetical protein
MATTRTYNTPKGRLKKRRTSLEENRERNLAKPVGNKTMEAFLRNQGTFIVYDPNFM